MHAAFLGQRSTALALWTANQVGIAGWSEVFFGQRAPGWGTVASAALGASAAGYVASANQTDKHAARLGISERKDLLDRIGRHRRLRRQDGRIDPIVIGAAATAGLTAGARHFSGEADAPDPALPRYAVSP